jgi:hypothetical protein
MGPWDIMSRHFVTFHSPPPGISSFTKIRLGWISPRQVDFVKPGQPRFVTLSPLSKSGDTLAIKVPLSRGQYYLIENRQPLGFDRVLPDSGVLILKVNPRAQEGAGTVRVMNANPIYSQFSEATFRLDRSKGNVFVDEKDHVAVIPLWNDGDNQNVLITTPEKSSSARESAELIQTLLDRHPEPRTIVQEELIKECIGAFKDLDFATCRQLAGGR